MNGSKHYPSVYGISRWTNAYRPHTYHINKDGQPLCGAPRQKSVFTWQPDNAHPNCKACARIAKKDAR
jgi:hypothetical protein